MKKKNFEKLIVLLIMKYLYDNKPSIFNKMNEYILNNKTLTPDIETIMNLLNLTYLMEEIELDDNVIDSNNDLLAWSIDYQID
jgi:hypothetical protein